jgi:hypothetical protein
LFRHDRAQIVLQLFTNRLVTLVTLPRSIWAHKSTQLLRSAPSDSQPRSAWHAEPIRWRCETRLHEVDKAKDLSDTVIFTDSPAGSLIHHHFLLVMSALSRDS